MLSILGMKMKAFIDYLQKKLYNKTTSMLILFTLITENSR